jgi:hypothetical protein
MANNNEISFNVTKPIWKLNRSVNGWQKEVNLVAWNGKKPKLDVREWNADKTKMRRGVTLSKDEVLELKRCLNSIDIDWLYDTHNAAASVQTEPGPAGAILRGHDHTVKEDLSEEEPPVLPESDEEADCKEEETPEAEEIDPSEE